MYSRQSVKSKATLFDFESTNRRSSDAVCERQIRMNNCIKFTVVFLSVSLTMILCIKASRSMINLFDITRQEEIFRMHRIDRARSMRKLLAIFIVDYLWFARCFCCITWTTRPNKCRLRRQFRNEISFGEQWNKQTRRPNERATELELSKMFSVLIDYVFDWSSNKTNVIDTQTHTHRAPTTE